jgi:hypothetical protein
VYVAEDRRAKTAVDALVPPTPEDEEGSRRGPSRAWDQLACRSFDRADGVGSHGVARVFEKNHACTRTHPRRNRRWTRVKRKETVIRDSRDSRKPKPVVKVSPD